MQSLLKANGRAIFVAGIGAVALTTNQISTVRHVFCDNPISETHKYMLYVLLNQNYISVDTSGCKITHIDVGTYRFSLPGFLKDYQKNGIYSMRAILDAGCHCLLADEMGLGKTLQVLALICSSDRSTKSLVVCPASVVFVWQREIEKFFPDKKSVAVDRNTDFDQDVDFFICSYAFVHRLNQRLKEVQFDYMVVDEAQYIKNPRSKTTVSCCNIDSRYRIAITGTPIENNLFDIWSIFRFLMPGFFCGYNQFQDSINYPEFRESFKKQVSTFTIRRTKKSVAIELPKRNELEILCQMSDAQRIAYENIRVELKKSMSKTSGDNNISSMNVLTAIMRLRQAACAQFILPETLRHDHSMNSPKIESLMIKLQNIAADGRKVVIFSQFLEMLDEISIRIKKEIPEMSVSMLTGKSRNREALVEEFQSTKNSAAMLISLKAGGVGITLHSAEYAFLMEPWWNPAVEEQAIARIHRIGQKNITTIYRMITENSIEERMRKIQSSKKDLFNEFIRTGVDNIAMTNFYLKNLESLIG
jgi:SNF2 family DNA or RNA helicase